MTRPKCYRALCNNPAYRTVIIPGLDERKPLCRECLYRLQSSRRATIASLTKRHIPHTLPALHEERL